MLAVGSNLHALLNNLHKEEEEEALFAMGVDEVVVLDVEEGEISDSNSVEEISESDFKKQDDMVSKPKGGSIANGESNGNASSNSRVWTMRDVYRYPISSGYTSGLYNIAWAQAVQNKPLGDVFVKIDPNEKSKSKSSLSSSDTSSTPVNSKEDQNNSVESSEKLSKEGGSDSELDVKMGESDEKEEGELEEGEIDGDFVPYENPRVAQVGASVSKAEDGGDLELNLEEEVKTTVGSGMEALKNVTVVDAEKSFAAVCSRLLSTFEKTQELIVGKTVPMENSLFEQSFSALKVFNTVFVSMNQHEKEQNKECYSRLLEWVMKQIPPLLLPEQMKEIEAMVSSLDKIKPSTEAGDKEKEVEVVSATNEVTSDIVAKNVEYVSLSSPSSSSSDKNELRMLSEELKPVLPSFKARTCSGRPLDLHKDHDVEYVSLSSPLPDKYELRMLSEELKPVLPSFKARTFSGPLLDLHKDHDVDSLPSPTRETTPCFPLQNALGPGVGYYKPEFSTSVVVCKAEDPVIYPYETDAVAAVSNYQQKFSQNSFLSGNRLPSPTPSGGDDGDADNSEEISSKASNNDIMRSFAPPVIPSALRSESGSVQVTTAGKNTGSVSTGSNNSIRASAKSRDPRLRLPNSSGNILDLHPQPPPVIMEPARCILSSRKQKATEESDVNGPSAKRPRNLLTTNEREMETQTAAQTGGWLEDIVVVEPQSTENNMSMINGVTSTGAGSGKHNVTIKSELPEILKNIVVDPTMLLNLLKMSEQQRQATESQQKYAEPAKNPTCPPSKNLIPAAVQQLNSSLKSSGLGQTANLVNEIGKVRMKPRDPRRVLLNTTSQVSGSLGSEQLKKTEAPALTAQRNKLNELVGATSMPSPASAPPDIGQQFTQNLQNLADIMTTSHVLATPIAQQSPLQPAPTSSSNSDIENKRGTPLTPVEGAASTTKPQNSWGEVEHLFDRFDDKQKAAIQKERARRILEQNKMFAARKLSLVLDLDHTLLNSAKFGEIDPVHDEILRKKEEQDREKPQRHLFRFPHMGMWTKLRPGIWNFLEKASKLFELHLDTMGNKLYATEMAKILDPRGVLFSGRIIARGADGGDLFDGEDRAPKNKDIDGVLGMESSIVIIDDSVRVWPYNMLNLIAVERYTYFPCSRRQLGLPGPSLLEIDHDERYEDGTLASTLAVLGRLHQTFFSNQSLDEVDVRNILATEQQKILGGCRIVFSRVFPVGEANPHLHPLWQTAQQFGAVCTNQIDDQVTHVVAKSLGTDKVNWALSTGRFVVHPGWVEASALLYRRANEQDFSIKP